MSEGKLDIDGWRDEIDRIDEELVRLLNERSKCAIEIGRIKREVGQPVYSPAREKQVLEHVTGVNLGPLDEEGIRRLFERIIDESRRIERVTVELEAKGHETARAGQKRKRRAR
ncbi:MAG TPA: chorismate mutase [Blastocatellia bacterium]|nr:chorismate mutase [Blastocatellia bacterium]